MKVKSLFGVLVLMYCVAQGSVFAEDKELDKDYVVAKIGKDKIYFSEIQRESEALNRFLKENFQTSKSWRLDFFRKHIAKLALARRANREGLDKQEDVSYEIKSAKTGILAEALLSRGLIQKLKINDENLRKYYEQNKEKYRTKAKVKLSYIKLESKKQADRIISRLNKGRSFEKAGGRKVTAIESWASEDAPYVSGLEEILTPEALDKIFRLDKGASSGVLEIKDEFYIFHIDEKEPARQKPFEEVRREVEFAYTREEKDRIVNELIRETFSQEEVELYEDKVVEGM